MQDPRASTGFLGAGKYRVTRFDEPTATVIARSDTGQGAYAVADPRPGMRRELGDHYLTGRHYGVMSWDQPSGTVSAAACDNGRWSVADPRLSALSDKLVAIIRALDGTWHGLVTTFELACLQSLVEPEEYLVTGRPERSGLARVGDFLAEKFVHLRHNGAADSKLWSKRMMEPLVGQRSHQQLGVDGGPCKSCGFVYCFRIISDQPVFPAITEESEG